MIDETALLEALEAGTIGGAGIDVFTSEPPQPDSTAARLIAHPKVVATPHLGASTVEAQENVSIDVCEQVIAILAGQLPRSAVNAPLILPEEYRTLAPFVSLVDKMGSLYTQLYSSRRSQGFRTTFDLTYEGSLAEIKTTKPLFAALVKGLMAPISSLDGLNINLVNAELVAKERGLLINEQRSRENIEDKGYSSFVTLRARLSRSASVPREAQPPNPKDFEDQIIQGYVSANTPYISRLGRFSTNFVPNGNMLICRNYDSPGKIGTVGALLGKQGVNISSMIVAPLDASAEQQRQQQQGSGNGVAEKEALMILGVDRAVEKEVVKSLIDEEGVLEADVVTL